MNKPTIPPELLTVDSLTTVGIFIKGKCTNFGFLNENPVAAVLWDWIQTHRPVKPDDMIAVWYPPEYTNARNWEHWLAGHGNTCLQDAPAFLQALLDEHLPEAPERR